MNQWERELAVVGVGVKIQQAEANLANLRAQEAELLKKIGSKSRRVNGSISLPPARTAPAEARSTPPRQAGARKRNWNMSDAQKKAVSERMKKYWAGRRKQKAGRA